jgi:Fic family protein
VLSFTPSKTLEKELKALHVRLAVTSKGLEGLHAAEAEYLRRCALVSNVGASTRIENAVLTDPEIEWVDTTLSLSGKPTAFEEKKQAILDKLSKDRERSIEEVIGCRDVLMTVYGQARDFFPLTESVLRALHHQLLRYYPAASHYAGQYKTTSNRVVSRSHETGEERVVLEPSPPGVITATAVADLVRWYNQALPEHPWALLVATEFVFRFLAIHPFQDGNGRLGRALFILVLLQGDDPYLARVMPYIAIDRHIEQHRARYYAALHQCSHGRYRPEPREYDYEPLARFFLKMLEAALADINVYRQRYNALQNLSEAARKVLACFKAAPEIRLQAADIVSATGLPRRTAQYALKGLADKGFLQRLGLGAGARYQLVF